MNKLKPRMRHCREKRQSRSLCFSWIAGRTRYRQLAGMTFEFVANFLDTTLEGVTGKSFHHGGDYDGIRTVKGELYGIKEKNAIRQNSGGA